jgi:tripartite-type tricarboxylate transporter receptor subunit TctC
MFRAACLATSLLAAPAAFAQSSGPITLLVGYSAGGSADFAARVIASEIASRIGRTVVVENATGASGMIALQKLVNSKADTNTMYYGGFDTVAVPLVNKDVKIDWRQQTIPVSRTVVTSMAFAVLKESPYTDLATFVAAAKADPSNLTYGTPGIASAQHFLGEMISSRATIKLLHAPYRGGAQVSNDLLGGILNSAVLTTSTALPFVQQDKIRVLFVSDAARSSQLPDVPALSEVPGFEGLSLPLWQGIFVKSGTPDDFVKKLEIAIAEGLKSPEAQKRYAAAGFSTSPLGGKAFQDFVQAQADAYQTIITEAKITAE